jgi:hypothetical protein
LRHSVTESLGTLRANHTPSVIPCTGAQSRPATIVTTAQSRRTSPRTGLCPPSGFAGLRQARAPHHSGQCRHPGCRAHRLVRGPRSQAAKLGASTIVVIDQHEHRLDMASRLGATATVSLTASAAERKARVAELCGSRGPRVVVEAAGVLSAFGEGIDLAGHNGAYLLLGLWSGHGTTPVDPTVLVHKNLRIIGSCFAQPEHYYRAMHLAAQLEQRLPLTEIITHQFDVFRADEALDTVENGLAVKAVIQPARRASGATQVR